MNKNQQIILIFSLCAGVSIAVLTGANLLDTFAIKHAVGNTSNLSTNSITFDEESTSTTSTSESSSSKSSVTYSTSSFGCKNDVQVNYHLQKIVLSSTASIHRYIYNEDGVYGVGYHKTVSAQVNILTNEGYDVLAAINGDSCFYDKSNLGYIIADGVKYNRTNSALRSANYDDFAIFGNGSVMSYSEQDYSLSTIQNMNGGCYQNFNFGPSLIDDGVIQVTTTSEIDGKNMNADQRTAIGYAGNKTYYFLTTDINGTSRDDPSSTGFRLYDLAMLLQNLGCSYAYNLDGGRSTAMYVKGVGTVGDNTNNQREISDIVYICD